jgi:DNA-binding MarR family transcriptional regulator
LGAFISWVWDKAMAKAASKKTGARAARKTSGAIRKRPTVKRATLGPIGKLEDFIPYKLSVVANRVSQSIGRLFETQFNIQVPEWRIMMALYAYDDLAFNEVVDQTSMDKARVSRAQRRLVDLALINTVNDPTDGRKVILSLTAKGEKMCADILPHVAEREAWYLAALDDQEHHQLDVILDKLMKRSQEA